MPTDRDDDKGFTVTDRRHFTGTGEAGPEREPAAPAAANANAAAPGAPAAPPAATSAPAAAAPGAEPPQAPKRHAPLPEIDFATFILSLGTSALFHLGEMPRPEAEAPAKNLPLAKQTIDILALLRDKTKGNLAPDEAQLLDSLLYDLRMKYVATTRK
jgi:pyruvate/2-oxoglutarate dehydrogenase complex dihydrolipoamide acyltransferase (E2) component